MINTNELMLGNYIKLPNGRIKKVESITGVAVGYWNNKNKNYSYQLNKLIRPIPITKEILEKCGFKPSYGDYINEKGDKVYHFAGYWHFDIDNCSIPFFYLHQLQNLYFLITGKQLEINL